MIDPLGLTLCSYFANALGFDTLLIQLNDTWSFSQLMRFSFAELKKPAIYIFFRNLHLLSFPTIYNLPCFPLKWRAYEFFPRGPPRRSGVTLRYRFPLDHKNLIFMVMIMIMFMIVMSLVGTKP